MMAQGGAKESERENTVFFRDKERTEARICSGATSSLPCALCPRACFFCSLLHVVILNPTINGPNRPCSSEQKNIWSLCPKTACSSSLENSVAHTWCGQSAQNKSYSQMATLFNSQSTHNMLHAVRVDVVLHQAVSNMTSTAPSTVHFNKLGGNMFYEQNI